MNCTKKLTIIGYTVKYADLREAKPRPVHEEVYTIDKDGLDALGLLGIGAADFIKSRYERGGYHVVSVERIAPKRVVTVDLKQLYAVAAKELNKHCLISYITAKLDSLSEQNLKTIYFMVRILTRDYTKENEV